MTGDLTADSKLLAYVLRHHPEEFGVELDGAGWVAADDLLAALAARGRPISAARLRALVDAPGKRRFELVAGRVRAAQGHSVDVDLGLAPTAPPDVLYHGTVARFLPAIRREGLLRGRRRHVHLSVDVTTATEVGARRGDPVVLRVAAGPMHAAGHTFYLAANGVWLTATVPPAYLTEVRPR
jgi:putative RNA 2'-phosphotransferase